MNSFSTDSRLRGLLDALAGRDLQPDRPTNGSATFAQPSQLLDELLALADEPAAAKTDLWSTVVQQLVRWWEASRTTDGATSIGDDSAEKIAKLYGKLNVEGLRRAGLLTLFARYGTNAALERFAELLVVDPPETAEEANIALVPLFQRDDYEPGALFPRLLDALAHRAVAAGVLDLANYLTQRGRIARHPAADRAGQLAALLGALVQRLAVLGQAGPASVSAVAERRTQVNDTTALVIALVHAALLLRDPAFVGKLYQTIELPHRRLRLEAATALARLGEQQGVEMLAQLAHEPLVRAQALGVLEEIGKLDRVDETVLSPVARAEGELVGWLADSRRFGFPPESLEVVDQRRLFWPGYERPVDCYLFRYHYPLPQGDLQGIALVGPETHAFQSDLSHLPVEEIYAAFAGWQAEHPEISESPLAEAQELPEQRDWIAWLQEQGYSDVRWEKLGRFFGEQFLVARALKAGQPGTVVIGIDRRDRPAEQSVAWYSRGNPARPITPVDAYNIHKGRMLLAVFNPRASF